MPTRRVPWIVASAIGCVAVATGCGSTVQYAGDARQLDGISTIGGTSSESPVDIPQQDAAGPSSVREREVVGPSSGTPHPDDGTPGVVSPALPNGPRNTRPIKVGFLTIDYSKAYAAVGLSSGPAFDWKANYRALVDGMNKRGGLHGRRIQAVFHAIDGTAASYSTAAQAACSYLVEDQHVEAVLSYAASAQSMILTPCFQRAGIAQIEGNFSLREDVADLRKSPGYIAPESMTVDRYSHALLTWAHEEGWLTPKNRLGVFIEGCPWDLRAYDHVVEPLAKSFGVQVEKYTTSCIVGWGEVTQTVSDVQSAALRFRANGVDRVMYLTLGESGINGLFTQNAEQQHYYPTYFVTSITQPVNGAQIGQIASSQLPNTRGIGWNPGWDVNEPAWSQAQLGVQETCRALARAGGTRFPEPTGPQANLNPYIECDTILLLERVLGMTGGSTAYAAISSAVDRLAASYLSPMTSGPASFTSGRHAGADRAALFSYKAACRCFSYDTAARPVP